MCGIAGIVDLTDRREPDRALLERMNQSQFHRGPDEGGYHLEAGVGLAHRRLSIIDLSAGQQPMHSADGERVVVFNGEIYNFIEVRKKLQALGQQFRTHSDTEVILAGWAVWGEQCVDHFRGMFAFALWDRPRQTLFLARDRLGVKPLYYALIDGWLLFGSELKVLLCDPRLSRRLDPTAIEEYFALGYVPDPKCILSSVQKLPAGHTLCLQRGQGVPASREYWDIPFTPLPQASEAELAEELIERLREAVTIRMIAEVPLGAFLSGGVDSSAVVAMMAQAQQEPVNTCSIGFDVAAFDESSYALQVAERYHTQHHVKRVDPNDFDLIDRLAALYDEPFADSSALPTYRVCQLARERVTVALSGDGGDENFAGYRRYRWHMNEERLRGLLPRTIRRPLFGTLGRLYPKLDWAPRYLRAQSTFQALARDPIEGYFHNFSILVDAQRDQLYSDAFKRQLQGYRAVELFRHHAERAPTEDPLARVQYIDMKTYLVGDILTKVDRASMAHALEVREPLLDHPLIEWASGLPADFKLRGQQGKYLLKRALEPHLSNEILYRDKMGFAVPLANWFRGPLKERLRRSLLEGVLADSGLFNGDSITQLVEQHQSGRRDHSAALWSLLMFESSLRHLGVQ
ncbi:MAG: amidotransferase 1, exosortase A system-associated [Pseudomonadales bacterium]|jgi:asparagine synthase (glutamine-hydrolysing)|nr:amidotransferase 1, exosortase A system-associated [Pseudomonadales bacterium]MCP5331952.1 amidotransferase 1, exosortase A system-associated [Pseudomonadales bacterium]HMU89704.1 amidotransferase 1, exosortase A system-associated [Pseudomonadales bacterium]HMW14555.1 amidotransferase 1, exosortase A system-associated [Pseudomonadales bacterium]HMY96986.1 amidotransferase 1, exosortase A system-associated [Pseudomonadales bacterium]